MTLDGGTNTDNAQFAIIYGKPDFDFDDNMAGYHVSSWVEQDLE